jgi:hypothetical protein
VSDYLLSFSPSFPSSVCLSPFPSSLFSPLSFFPLSLPSLSLSLFLYLLYSLIQLMIRSEMIVTKEQNSLKIENMSEISLSPNILFRYLIDIVKSHRELSKCRAGILDTVCHSLKQKSQKRKRRGGREQEETISLSSSFPFLSFSSPSFLSFSFLLLWFSFLSLLNR